MRLTALVDVEIPREHEASARSWFARYMEGQHFQVHALNGYIVLGYIPSPEELEDRGVPMDEVTT